MSLRLPIDPGSATPLYRQLTDGLRAAIAAGQLAPGEALPNIRELAALLRVNYHTVARACQELEDSGLLSRKRGGPFCVAEGAQPDAGEQALRDNLRALAREALSRGLPPERVQAWWAEALAEAAALTPQALPSPAAPSEKP
jgi:GntR family transcriptional regulator